MQATGVIDESQKKKDENANERWQQIASLLTIDAEQLQCLSALRTSMRSRYCSPIQKHMRSFMECKATFLQKNSGSSRFRNSGSACMWYSA